MGGDSVWRTEHSFLRVQPHAIQNALGNRGQRALRIKGRGVKATRHLEAHGASRQGTVTREVSWLDCIPEVRK